MVVFSANKVVFPFWELARKRMYPGKTLIRGKSRYSSCTTEWLVRAAHVLVQAWPNQLYCIAAAIECARGNGAQCLLRGV
jgi:hypothetical protein